MNWVKIEDEAPRLASRVLIINNGHIEISYYDMGYDDQSQFYHDRGESIYRQVSHWASLPRSPKQ